ncbi:acyl-CoA dehydrogenase [Novosphingobium malaysiense]|uniref:Acyl-CoA dehydrogenase n=1 Tax=Novosphingobium malaysiense TaxID=1348853 RepID=A0A0B1ZEN8_9SPHN|nr:acyl-CoA dehydrogenase [Novosphingobium malaysiense]KHK88975.1 hypothetical protein LK12_23075 [Novosphingobium malaysiense]
MQLNLPADSEPVQDMFARLFEAESTPERVRLAEPVGFDFELWKSLVEVEAPFIRFPAELDGGNMPLLDACVMMEEAGRRLASVPLAEAVVALRLLAKLDQEAARVWADRVREEGAVLTLGLTKSGTQFVPGGAVASGIMICDGETVSIVTPVSPLERPQTLGGNAIGVLTGKVTGREIVGSGAAAVALWQQAVEEWKILMSSALVGLSLEALRMASQYASERIAFGVPIGTYQGISHPLANNVIDADGAKMYLWWVLKALEDGDPCAAANISILFWWASRTASNSVGHALHTFGGYGLTNEYDIQLYHRRAKAWPLVLGDPQQVLQQGGRRLVHGDLGVVPETGVIDLDFNPPDYGSALADETRAIFDEVLDPAKHRLGEANFEAHDWDVHRALGKAGLLYPDWPEEWGGRSARMDEARGCVSVWHDVGYIGHARSVTAMVGAIVLAFGIDELKEEVVRSFASGEITACLGYTEPSGGSDVFAAKTRAVRDGDDWIINGQKMFTSGAELASYVIMIARTDPDAPKHKGITLFLVPLNLEGVEIHPVHTFMDERTNATFYSDVRIPDRYRLGEVNAGVKVMSAALSLEQGGGGYDVDIRDMMEAVLEWARDEEANGRPLVEDEAFLSRIAKTEAYCRVGAALNARARWASTVGAANPAFGPASKVFSTEAFISCSTDLLDLAAPRSLLRGKEGLGLVEMGYRHSTATTIYAGTSEVLRSMVAERRLGLPRSRS